MSTRLLRLPDVMDRTGLPKSTIYMRMSQGRFPKSIVLGFRTVAWLEADIEAWIEECVRLSRAAMKSPERRFG